MVERRLGCDWYFYADSPDDAVLAPRILVFLQKLTEIRRVVRESSLVRSAHSGLAEKSRHQPESEMLGQLDDGLLKRAAFFLAGSTLCSLGAHRYDGSCRTLHRDPENCSSAHHASYSRGCVTLGPFPVRVRSDICPFFSQARAEVQSLIHECFRFVILLVCIKNSWHPCCSN